MGSEKNMRILGIALLASSTVRPCLAADLLLANMVKNYRGSTVYIVARKETKTGEIVDEFGTGFIISRDGYILTSCHVVNRAILDDKGKDSGKVVDSVELKGAVGSREEATERLGLVTCAQPPIDLALLKFANTFRQRVSIPVDRLAALSIGDVVASMGYPLDVEFFPRRGTIGASTADGTYNVDMTMTRGDSGSPVFNEGLNVVGIAESGYAGTQIGFVRPIRHAAGLLTLANIEITATNASISSAPKPDAPIGSKVEVATSAKEAIEAFTAAAGYMPNSPTARVTVTYPLLKLFGFGASASSTANNSSVAVSEIKAKPGFKIVDAKFIALAEQNAKVVSIAPSVDGTTARAAILTEAQGASQQSSGAVRGFIETIQVPLATTVQGPPPKK